MLIQTEVPGLKPNHLLTGEEVEAGGSSSIGPRAFGP